MDCSIVPSRHEGLFQVSTVDFFYPLVEDPYLQGRIACANVLSDLYALGVVECDNLLMSLGASLDMAKEHRTVVTREMMRGFNDLAKEAGTRVTGGQSILNPWPIIGGTAMSVCREEDMIRPEGALPGDVLVLTKPLGTQLAVNAHQWMQPGHEASWKKVEHLITREQALGAYHTACESMARLNLEAARAMHRFQCHGATDVTGFGIVGHADNLARAQKLQLRFELHALPVIRHMMDLDAAKPGVFKLAEGFSAETSGGILTTIAAEHAQAFIDSLSHPAWIVGKVVASDEPSCAVLLPGYRVIEC